MLASNISVYFVQENDLNNIFKNVSSIMQYYFVWNVAYRLTKLFLNKMADTLQVLFSKNLCSDSKFTLFIFPGSNQL